MIDFWEMRLFDRYDIEREFEERTAYALRMCSRHDPKWFRYDDERITDDVMANARISPIRLLQDEATLSTLAPCGQLCEGKPLVTLMERIPFEGDDLWDLYVQQRDHPPQGEIRQLNLILYAHGLDEAEALACLGRERRLILDVLREQERSVISFNKRLRNLIRDELREAAYQRVVH